MLVETQSLLDNTISVARKIARCASHDAIEVKDHKQTISYPVLHDTVVLFPAQLRHYCCPMWRDANTLCSKL